MATFAEMMQGLSGKVNTTMNDPLMQLGLQLMNAGGYSQVPVTGGQRLAQAAQGYMQQQAQQEQLKQQQDLRSIQAQEIAVRQAALAQQENQRRAVQAAVENDPNLLAQHPGLRTILGATGDTSSIADMMKLYQPANNMAKMPWQRDVRDANGNITQEFYNPQTGNYEPRATYTPPDMINAESNQRRTAVQEQGLDLRERGLDIQQQNADTAAGRASAAQEKALRETNALQLKNRIAQKDLTVAYRGADSQMSRVEALANEIADSPALGRISGVQGKIPSLWGSEARDLNAKLENLVAQGGLSEIIRLGNAGIHLTPVSDNDIRMVQSSFANFDRTQSPEQMKKTLKDVAARIARARADARENFDLTNQLYTGATQPNVPAPSTDYARPATQSDYDALPSGAQYIDPATGRVARKR